MFQPIWNILYSQSGLFPWVGVKIKRNLKPPPRKCLGAPPNPTQTCIICIKAIAIFHLRDFSSQTWRRLAQVGNHGNLRGTQPPKALTHRICVWYIYLHESLTFISFMVNVAKYTTINGSYGKGTWALLLLKGYKLSKPSLSLNHPRS